MKRKYEIDQNVFDEVNENSAYWLGFLYGDGNCTCENKIKLGLSWEDRGLLFQFRDFVKSNDRPVKECLYSGIHSARFEFRSWRIHNQIRKFELTKLKENRGRLHASLLQKEVARHFIRGLFDADGSFYYDGTHKNHLFSELTGYMPVLRDVKNILVMEDVISEGKKIVKNGRVFRIRLAQKDTLKLIPYLYGDNPTYFLRRKYAIANNYLQRLNERTSSEDATV